MKTKKLISNLRSLVSILVCFMVLQGLMMLCNFELWGIAVIAVAVILQKFFGDKDMIRKEGGC